MNATKTKSQALPHPSLAVLLKWGIQKLKTLPSPLRYHTVETLLLESLSSSRKKLFPFSLASLYAYPEFKLNREELRTFQNFIKRTLKGEPLAYLIQEQEFYGFKFYVDRRVLIPRPETELIIEEALFSIKNLSPHYPLTIIDLGTGSGCLAITLALLLPSGAQIFATDISPSALRVAQINAKRHKVFQRIKFIQSNLLTFLLQKKDNFSLLSKEKQKPATLILLANLPYISQEEYLALPLSVKNYEPKQALWAGKEGLKHYKTLFNQLSSLQTTLFQKSKLILILEISPQQVCSIKKLTQKYLKGSTIKITKDYRDLARVITICLSP